MTWLLSQKSLDNLYNVHPELDDVVRLAIKRSKVDFGVAEGLRFLSRQEKLVASGDSWTLDSYHLKQPLTGFSHAVDLWAYRGNRVSWEWEDYFAIAESVQNASLDLEVPIVWGGVWPRILGEIKEDLGEAQNVYVADFRKKHGRAPRLDGPHFQLSEKYYPRKCI